jgi:16S rRNA (cytidine1402-2'-O)-methyltransferase
MSELLVVATPLGNLGDLSPRAKEALGRADVIAAEDTRVTRRLLTAMEIPAPTLVSYWGREEAQKAAMLVERIQGGETVALVCDAGTPNVSDPGQHLVRLCHENDIPVRTVAGPSALTAAVSVAGLPPVPLHFLAFSPRKPGPVRRWIRRYAALPGTLVIYEAPGRTLATLRIIAEELPDRQVCMARELTKLHEQVVTKSAADLVELLKDQRIRGEVVLLVGPGAPPVDDTPEASMDSLKDIAAALAKRWGCTRREAYQKLLALENER